MYLRHSSRLRKTAGEVVPAALIICIAAVLAGCGGGERYGRLMGVRGIYDQMRQGPIGSDYQYFKAPSVAVPNAIIAIHKDYSLSTKSWSVINLEEGKSQGWHVRKESMGSSPMLLEIQGPRGAHIGLWYSVWTSTVVKIQPDNVVQVYPPSSGTGTEGRNHD